MCLKCRLFSNEVRRCNCECTYFFYIKNRAGCEPYSTDYVLPTISLCLFFHLALLIKGCVYYTTDQGKKEEDS